MSSQDFIQKENATMNHNVQVPTKQIVLDFNEGIKVESSKSNALRSFFSGADIKTNHVPHTDLVQKITVTFPESGKVLHSELTTLKAFFPSANVSTNLISDAVPDYMRIDEITSIFSKSYSFSAFDSLVESVVGIKSRRLLDENHTHTTSMDGIVWEVMRKLSEDGWLERLVGKALWERRFDDDLKAFGEKHGIEAVRPFVEKPLPSPQPSTQSPARTISSLFRPLSRTSTEPESAPSPSSHAPSLSPSLQPPQKANLRRVKLNKSVLAEIVPILTDTYGLGDLFLLVMRVGYNIDSMLSEREQRDRSTEVIRSLVLKALQGDWFDLLIGQALHERKNNEHLKAFAKKHGISPTHHEKGYFVHQQNTLEMAVNSRAMIVDGLVAGWGGLSDISISLLMGIGQHSIENYISTSGNRTETCNNLVGVAVQQGWIAELVESMKKERPKSELIQSIPMDQLPE